MNENKTSNLEFGLLSSSSKSAIGWAITSAKMATETQKGKATKSGSAPKLDTFDLLAGVILSHQGYSEPEVIFDYLGLSSSSFFEDMEKRKKLSPKNAKKYRPEPASDFPEMKEEAGEVIDKVFHLYEQYNSSSDPVISLKFLFGGLFLGQSPACTLLRSHWLGAPISIEALIKTYPRFLEGHDQYSSYKNFLEIFHPLAISGFNSDTVDSDLDMIGIGQEVNAFAYLMASTSLKPPLAIGLFGHWGSGKSFFMKSLQKRIHKITADARNSDQPQREIDIFKNVVQIEFNAWQYVESDLWASIVDHIFRNLRMHGEDQPDLLKERQDELIKQLKEAKLEKDVAAKRMNVLKEELDQKKKDLDILVEERDQKLQDLDRLKEEDVINAVELSEEDKENFREILDRIGLTAASDSAADFLNAFDEMKRVLRRGNALVHAQVKGPWQLTVILIAILISIPTISLLLESFLDGTLVDTPVFKFFSTLSAALVMLTGYIRSANKWLLDKIDKAEKAKAKLLQRIEQEKADHKQKIRNAEVAYSAAEKKVENAKLEEENLEERIQEIEYELEIVPVQLLRGFVDERSESKDYRDRLGLMALVRRDFEQLSTLIEIQNKGILENEKLENKHIINRIVLYIDDLDRCPVNKVVEVLQAVHLLLTFPLFVVMVAVDSRWLSISLQNHYKNLLINNFSESFPGNRLKQATPQDYLEKIFQIPFWISPLVEDARMRIVRGLMKNGLIVEKRDDEKGGDGLQAHHESTGVEFNINNQFNSLAANLETNLKPKSLETLQEELSFIEDIKEMLGESPRSVKRFVNVYRLIKAIGLSFEPDFNKESEFAPYKLVLFLLSVFTGLPAVSRPLKDALQSSMIGENDNPGNQLIPRKLDDVLVDLKNNTNQFPHSIAFTEQHQQLANWVENYQDGKWKELPVKDLQPWLKQVIRFSYHDEVFS